MCVWVGKEKVSDVREVGVERMRQRGAASESDDETKKKKEKAFQLLLSLPLQPPHSLFSPSCSLILTRSEPPTMPTLTCCGLVLRERGKGRERKRELSIGLFRFFVVVAAPSGLCFSFCLCRPPSPFFGNFSYLAQLLEEVERLGIGRLFVERGVEGAWSGKRTTGRRGRQRPSRPSIDRSF